jgi:16S rRNA (guanine527-N7)-methyltransferase
VVLTQDQEKRLRELMRVFLAENTLINLSAYRTEETCWAGNILDSLALWELAADLSSPRAIMDVGIGGGFPILPLAMMLPSLSFTGIDSVQKKIDAVRRIAAAVNLTNVTLATGRAEELGRLDKYREKFSLVLSRAVAPINVLLEYCSPFAEVGGRIVLWKSMNIEEELEESLLARAEFSCHLAGRHQYDLPGSWGKRQLLIFEKASPLSPKYPRGVGIPKKHPLQ